MTRAPDQHYRTDHYCWLRYRLPAADPLPKPTRPLNRAGRFASQAEHTTTTHTNTETTMPELGTAMPELGTATLKVEADTAPAEASFARLRTAAAWGSRTPREVALDYAINSMPHNAGPKATVDRAEAFLAFLDPEA